MKAASLVVASLLLAACAGVDPRPPVRPVVAVSPAQPSIEEQASDADRTSRPRAEHKRLDALAGAWATTVVSVAADGKESDPHAGEARIRWILGGRYLEWTATLEIGPNVHATTGYLGFDLNHGEYQLLMISDLATGMGVAHGTGEITGAGIHLLLEIVDGRDGSVRRTQSTLKLIEHDHFVLDQIGLGPEGVERVVRRTHYRRSAQPGA